MSRDPFVKLPHAVIDHADLDLYEFAVYIVLLRFRDPKTKRCFPGMSTIADAARMSVKTASKTIRRLEERNLIRVERAKALGARTNASNQYVVGDLPTDPQEVLANSVKGKRKPRRALSEESRARLSAAARKRGSASEAVPLENNDESYAQGTASEAVRSASEALGVVPPRHTKKNHIKKNHEEDTTPAFKESRFENVSFDPSEELFATEEQVMYLKDLVIHQGYESGYETIPEEEHLARWRQMTRREAHDLIREYLKSLGRPDEIYYPEYGTPEYEALSPAGQAFAESAGMPDSVFDYGSKPKENVA